MPRTRSTGLALAVVAALGLAACSSNSTGAEDTTPASSGGSAAGYVPPPCRTKRPAPPEVVPVDGVPHDFTMTSFDGTRIRFHWYPLDHEAPTVLMGPGWGSAGATESSGTGLFGDAPIGVLHEQGYHVLTWDPRGLRTVDRRHRGRQRGGRRSRRAPAPRLDRRPARRAARPPVRPPRGDGGRLVRRRDPARHGGDRLSGGRHRPHDRVALARHEPAQGRHREARLVGHPLLGRREPEPRPAHHLRLRIGQGDGRHQRRGRGVVPVSAGRARSSPGSPRRRSSSRAPSTPSSRSTKP